jgi:hypothetical protein
MLHFNVTSGHMPQMWADVDGRGGLAAIVSLMCSRWEALWSGRQQPPAAAPAAHQGAPTEDDVHPSICSERATAAGRGGGVRSLDEVDVLLAAAQADRVAQATVGRGLRRPQAQAPGQQGHQALWVAAATRDAWGRLGVTCTNYTNIGWLATPRDHTTTTIRLILKPRITTFHLIHYQVSIGVFGIQMSLWHDVLEPSAWAWCNSRASALNPSSC